MKTFTKISLILFLVTILFAGSLFAQTNYSISKIYDLTDSLVAYYPFNGNTNDESGNGYDGTNNGAVPTKDRFGNENSAYHFDGIDDWIEAGLNIKEPTGTISMWFKAEELENSMLFCQIHHPNSPATLNYKLSNNGDDEGFLDIRSDAGIQAGISNKEITTLNEWHHLVCIWGENGSRLYFDGELQDSTNLTYYDNSSTINMGIGCYNGHHPRAHYFHGSIDDMRIYKRVLSTSEVQELYNENSLVAHYPFNGNTNDESGNGYNGTNNGSELTIDRFGNDSSAYYFDGVDDWIEAGLNIKEPTGTISMWFKAEELENSMLFCQIHHPNSPATLNYKLSDNGDDEGFLDIRSDAGIQAGISNKEITTLNEWHHLVCIWGGNGSKLYFDGELQDSTNLTYYDNSSTINMGIGCYNVSVR